MQCDLCTSTDILQHKRRYCSVSLSLPPSKPYTTNRQVCQGFFRGCHFASSSWYCSACRVCVPVNILLYISASNIWQNMEPVCCSASDVWSKALTKCFTKLYVTWNCDSKFLSAGTRASCTPGIVVFWLAILFWRNSGYSQRKQEYLVYAPCKPRWTNSIIKVPMNTQDVTFKANFLQQSWRFHRLPSNEQTEQLYWWKTDCRCAEI